MATSCTGAISRAMAIRIDVTEGKRRKTVMTKQVNKGPWSYSEERRLIQLVASSKSLEAIAVEMNRTPKGVTQIATRNGLSLKSDAGRKAK